MSLIELRLPQTDGGSLDNQFAWRPVAYSCVDNVLLKQEQMTV